MALHAGCGATFHELRSLPGVQSAGECTVSGHRVGLRVVRHVNAADPWPTNGVRVPNFVGNGWIVHTKNVAALDAVGASLAG
jgi:hypothetical protein